MATTNVWCPTIAGPSEVEASTDHVVNPFEGQTLTTGPMRLVQVVEADGTSKVDAPILAGWYKNTAVPGTIRVTHNAMPTSVSPQDVADAITATSKTADALPSAFEVTVGSYNYESYPALSTGYSITHIAPSPTMDGTLFAIEDSGADQKNLLVKTPTAASWATFSGTDATALFTTEVIVEIVPLSNTRVLISYTVEGTPATSVIRPAETVADGLVTRSIAIETSLKIGTIGSGIAIMFYVNSNTNFMEAIDASGPTNASLANSIAVQLILPAATQPNILMASNTSGIYMITTNTTEVFTVAASAIVPGMLMDSVVASGDALVRPTSMTASSSILYGGLDNNGGGVSRVSKRTGPLNDFSTEIISQGLPSVTVVASPL